MDVYLQGVFQSVVQFHNGCLVSTAVAVVWSTKDGHHILIMAPVVALQIQSHVYGRISFCVHDHVTKMKNTQNEQTDFCFLILYLTNIDTTAVSVCVYQVNTLSGRQTEKLCTLVTSLRCHGYRFF